MIVQDAQSNDHQRSISQSFQALEANRGGYYEWTKQFEDISSENGQYLDPVGQNQVIAYDFTCYGYRRITAEFKNPDHAVNHKRVLKIMLQEKLINGAWKRRIRLQD